MNVQITPEQQAALKIMDDILSMDTITNWRQRIAGVLASYVYLMTEFPGEVPVSNYKPELETLGLLHQLFSIEIPASSDTVTPDTDE